MLRSIVLLATLFPLSALAQTVTGIVMDASTGEPLPAATVQIAGTLKGTITNADGRYAISVQERPATLEVRFIGYGTGRVQVEAGQDKANVFLAPSTLELETVEVTGEDPAINIMRKVIERKAEWRAALETWKAEAYTRITFSNDTGIVGITESLSDAYWKQKKGLREVARGTRKTTNLDFADALPAAIFMNNLYDDDIRIGGYRFYGPTHPDALDQYDFSLEGYRYLDDQLVYDISFTPKSQLGTAFIGTLAILDGAYAMLEVEAEPNESFLFPIPIKRYDVRMQQQFRNFGGEIWLPVDYRQRGELEIGFTGLSLPPILLDQVTRLSDYAVNTAVPDSLFERNRFLAATDSSVSVDTLFAARDLVPLTARESEAYAEIDSTQTLDKAYAPTGALARFTQTNSSEGNVSMGSDGTGSPLGLSPRVGFNRVDGFALGASASRRFGPVRLSGGGSYLTSAERWSYDVSGRMRISRVRLEAGYRDETATRAPTDAFTRLYAGTFSVLGWEDPFDYFRREGWYAQLSSRLSRADLNVQVRYLDEALSSLDTATDYSLFSDLERRLNPLISEGRDRAFEVELAWGGPFVPVAGNRRFSLNVTQAPGGLGDFDYGRAEAALDYRIETFFRRRFVPNALDIRLTAGTSWGDLPLQRFLFLKPGMAGVSATGTLRTAPYRSYEGQHYVGIFWEHNFRTVPFELIGLRSLAEAGVYLSVHGGHGRTWIDEDRLAELEANSDPVYLGRFHHEIGIGIHNAFGLPVRFDATTRLDAAGFRLGIGFARIF
ncbi:MAG: DUF5686 family protein [Bacteroidota bacterium]